MPFTYMGVSENGRLPDQKIIIKDQKHKNAGIKKIKKDQLKNNNREPGLSRL